MLKNIKLLYLIFTLIYLSLVSNAETSYPKEFHKIEFGELIFIETVFENQEEIIKYEKELSEKLEKATYIEIGEVELNDFKKYLEDFKRNNPKYKFYSWDSVTVHNAIKNKKKKAEYLYFKSKYTEMVALTYYFKQKKMELFSCKFKNK